MRHLNSHVRHNHINDNKQNAKDGYDDIHSRLQANAQNRKQYIRAIAHIQGFTLIELMISLVLGLLISAAIIQVYIINTRTITVQRSASEVQDSAIFALQALDYNVRMSNAGNPISNITDKSDHGGIVLSGINLGDSSYANTGYLTISAGQTGTVGTNGWTGISNTDVPSDQLTIQYKNITPNSMFDCEGTEVLPASTDWVIERYYVRKATGAPTAIVQDLVLACDAGRVSATGGVVTDLGDIGEVVVPAVDQFKVLLGALTDVSTLTYLPAMTYLAVDEPLVGPKPAITTVKMGVIVRSDTPLVTDTDKDSFVVFGNTQTLKTDADRKKYYRRSYESTVLLRNARVMSVTGVAAPVPPP